jgi:hypothetical protein
VPDLRSLQDGHDSDRRVRDHGRRADALDAAWIGLGRDAVEDATAKWIDDHDCGLGIGRDERNRISGGTRERGAQHERRRARGDEELAAVHP